MIYDETILTGQRQRLVQQLKRKHITNQAVLGAIGIVPRHKFMKPDMAEFAYNDSAYPIGAGQTISQPYTVAFQTTLLCPEPGLKIMEIGTGSGYQAAILETLGLEVHSIERQQKLYEQTKRLLSLLKYQVNLYLGDGYLGLPAEAPFDRILITAGAREIPTDLLFQLKLNGTMVLPVGPESKQVMTRITRVDFEDFEQETFGEFTFVPMLNGIEKI